MKSLFGTRKVTKPNLAACRREEEASQLLAWIAKSRLKQGKNSPEIARFGNLAKPKGNFSGFSDSLLDRGGTPMLREHYPTDKRFEEILSYLPKMEASLAKIDRYLEDEKANRLIRQDLSKRWPKTLETGRGSTPVEVVLRMLVVRRLYKYSYEETEQAVSDR